MKKILNIVLSIFVAIALIFFGASSSWAKANPKGILDDNEISFLQHTLYPILIKSKLCVSATADCIALDYILCTSADALSCDIYGITNKRTINEILFAALNSGLPISSFIFWRNKHEAQSFFEKPIMEFIDRTGSK